MTPVFVDDVSINLFFAAIETGNPLDDGEVQIWCDAGFGRIDPATVDQYTVEPNPYTFWIDTDTSNYWICPQGKWQTTDVPQLQLDSWRLMNFLISRDYEMPVINVPITWAKVTVDLYVGIGEDATAIVVKRTDPQWEWTIRGTAGGTDTWTTANDLLAAKSAAAQAIGV